MADASDPILDAGRNVIQRLHNFEEAEPWDWSFEIATVEGLIAEVERLRADQRERVVLRVHHAPHVVTWQTLRETIAAAQGTVGCDMRGAFFDANREPSPSRVEVRVVVIPEASET